MCIESCRTSLSAYVLRACSNECALSFHSQRNFCRSGCNCLTSLKFWIILRNSSLAEQLYFSIITFLRRNVSLSLLSWNIELLHRWWLLIKFTNNLGIFRKQLLFGSERHIFSHLQALLYRGCFLYSTFETIFWDVFSRGNTIIFICWDLQLFSLRNVDASNRNFLSSSFLTTTLIFLSWGFRTHKCRILLLCQINNLWIIFRKTLLLLILVLATNFRSGKRFSSLTLFFVKTCKLFDLFACLAGNKL